MKFNHLFGEFSKHRRDSIQGTDYIANYFFLNLKVSRTKIVNVRWWFGGDIIPLTFGKFVATLVKKIGSQYLDWQFLFTLNILNFWIYHVIHFQKVSRIISPPNHHFRFPIFVLKNLNLSGNVVSILNWIRPLLKSLWQLWISKNEMYKLMPSIIEKN